ncbi:MAG: alpha-hydroxy acid oxidase, partial [Planctomycetota bacterium]
MTHQTIDAEAGRRSRRSFLRFLLGSPLLFAARPTWAMDETLGGGRGPDLPPGCEPPPRELIEAAGDAIDVFDFQAVAERNLSPAHYAYLSMGVQHEVTLRANRSAFERFQLRPRRLVDVRKLDTSTEILGTRLSSPILLAPAASQRGFHPEGELAVARAARRKGHVQILSTGSSAPLVEVAEALGTPPWFQLYTARVWPATRMQLKEAEDAGCPAVVLTVDIVANGANRDRMRRYRRGENPECRSCHASSAGDALRGLSDAARRVGLDPGAWLQKLLVLDWDYVDRIRDATSMKLWIKGILTPEDASLCVEHGVDGIVVSNHGGRAEDNGLSTIEVLPEIARAVDGRIPILVDSGFRRGTDVVKALALGASAVCVGRPYLWGLAAFGQPGVEAALGILRAELATTMKQMGTPTVA